MSLQGLLTGANPFYLLALTLLFLFFLYLRRHRSTVDHDARTVNSPETHEASHRASPTAPGVATAAATTAAGAALAQAHTGQLDHAQGAAHGAGHGSAPLSAAGNDYTLRVPGLDYDFTEDTLRRHNRYASGLTDTGTLAAGTATATATSVAGASHTATTAGSQTHVTRETISRDGVVAARTHVPDEYIYDEKRRSWALPLVAALTAALVSCQVASERGVLGTLADWLGGSKPAAVVAKIEAKVPSAEELKAKAEAAKAKVEEAAAAAKAKVANVAEKAIEAAKPDPKPEPKPEPKPAAAPVEAKPAPAVEAAAPLPPPVPGVTHFYGVTASVADAPFSAAAKMNPDYQTAPPPAPVAAPAPPVAVAEAPLPPPTPGLTSYFGLADRPDADQPWAAAAKLNLDYTAAAAPAPAPAPAAPPAPEPAPVSLGGVGQTSYFGLADKPDSSHPWAAGATMNPNYKVEAPKPVAAPAKPATPEVIESCRDALNAEAQAGKINFRTSSFEILPDSYKTLDTIAKMAKDCGGVIIEVGGHTDSTGKPVSNKTLSELRAKAVVRYLTGAGVDVAKLRAVGYGQDRPVATNDTDAGKRQNRRIEFLVSAP